MTELEKSIKILIEHTQHYIPTEDLEHLYAVIEAAGKLAEYETAEEEGRVLPCKVWNKVYIIDRYYLYKRESVVTKIEMDEDGLKIMIRDEIPVYSSGYNISDFGKTVFLTEGEADRVLREIEEKI